MTLLHITDYQEVKWTHQYEHIRACPLCNSTDLLVALEIEHQGSHEDEVTAYYCAVCGYWELLAQEWLQEDYKLDEHFFESRLENFDCVKDAIPSLAATIRRIMEHDDLHIMTPRQFEQFTYCYIKDLFDCDIAMTKTTRDGGYDIMCYESEIGPFIVEAKKYRRKKVDVAIVRQMAGVQLINGIPRSIIVTTGQTTQDAIREKGKLSAFTQYDLEIHDINDLMAWLDKKKHAPVRIDVRSILENTGFLRNTPVNCLIYDPQKGKLMFCES